MPILETIVTVGTRTGNEEVIGAILIIGVIGATSAEAG